MNLIIILSFFLAIVSANDYKVGVGTLNLNQKCKDYVNIALNNNRLSYGPFLQKFETSFANIHQNKFGVISNSGTSALQIALQAMKIFHKWDDGDEVIVPAVTFVATSNIVIHNNMKPIFVDIESDSYGIDAKLLEEKITDKTRAIIVVHLFGQPCNIEPIIQIANKYGLKIIEDSCETMFAKYKGKSVGNLGDIGCFSTYIAHLLVTGVGGLSITNNPDYAILMRSLVNHGRDSIYLSIDDDDNCSKEKLKEIIAKRFSFVHVGHSFRVTEMEGALGVAQLEDYEDMINKRRKNGKYLIEKLKKFENFLKLPTLKKDIEHSFMMFPIVLKNENKVNLVNFLENNGIETRDMLPLINQPIYIEKFNLLPKNYPVADWINKNGFYVGCHQDLKEEHLDYIVSKFEEYFNAK